MEPAESGGDRCPCDLEQSSSPTPSGSPMSAPYARPVMASVEKVRRDTRSPRVPEVYPRRTWRPPELSQSCITVVEQLFWELRFAPPRWPRDADRRSATRGGRWIGASGEWGDNPKMKLDPPHAPTKDAGMAQAAAGEEPERCKQEDGTEKNRQCGRRGVLEVVRLSLALRELRQQRAVVKRCERASGAGIAARRAMRSSLSAPSPSPGSVLDTCVRVPAVRFQKLGVMRIRIHDGGQSSFRNCALLVAGDGPHESTVPKPSACGTDEPRFRRTCHPHANPLGHCHKRCGEPTISQRGRQKRPCAVRDRALQRPGNGRGAPGLGADRPTGPWTMTTLER